MGAVDQLKLYAPCVYRPDDWVEVRCIRKKKVSKEWVQARDLLKPLARLDRQNRSGWNIYGGPNTRKDANLSGDENVLLCRCLFVDFDHIEAGDGMSPSDTVLAIIEDKGLPGPTLVVFSGHGVHCYWRLKEPLRPAEWRGIQERLNSHLGSDPTIKNPERIMRLRLMPNHKDLCFANRDIVYELGQIADALPALAKSEPAKPASAPRPDGYAQRKARAVLYAAKWPGCGEGHRNATAYRHSAQLLRDFMLYDVDAWEILREWNAGNTPPLPEEELRSAFQDAKKYGNRPEGSKAEGTAPPARAKAVTVQQEKAARPSDELNGLLQAQMEGRYTNVAWPWPILTDVGQFLTPGTRTLIVGGIGGSKSLLVLQGLAQWRTAGVSVAILELERKREFHLARILAQRSGCAAVTKCSWVQEHPDETQALFTEHRDTIDTLGVSIHTVPQQWYSAEACDWLQQRGDAGDKIIVIDPITSLARGREPWRDDDTFMARADKIASEYDAALIFVTHAKKGASHMPDLDSLAGSTAWARFADGVLWLEAHDRKVSAVSTCVGRDQHEHNRTIHLLKTRSGEGMGFRIAYDFSVPEGLILHELGTVVRKSKG